jgi:hypothetical protein
MSIHYNRTPVQRFEGFIGYGKQTCDDCYRMSPEARDETDGEFWPTPAITYLNDDADSAVEFFARTTCAYHDTDAQVPEEATHRVIDEQEYVGDDPDRMNSAYTHNATEVEEL